MGAPRAALVAALLLLCALSFPAAAAASHVYVSGSTGNNVSPFSSAANGSLTPISCPGSNCTAGTAPLGMAISPNGQYLYAASFSANKVSVFAAAANGSLTPVSCGSGCNTGTGPYSVAISPAGQFLYAVNQSANTVSPFSINSDGTLSPIACSGSNCNTGTFPWGAAVSPSGQYLYVTNRTSATISVYSIAANGSLTPVSCATCTTGAQPDGIAITPNGQYLYTANRSGASVSPFSINANGTLTPISCSGCGTGTNGAFSLAVSPSGQYVYTTIRNATAKIAAFSINANGSLTSVSCSGCSIGANPSGVAVSADSKFLYAAAFNTSLAYPYSIGATGALTAIACTSPNCNTSAGPDFNSVVIRPDQAPVAAFSASPARPGQASSFDASASTASTGQSVARYDWDYGDGQSASNAGPTPTHTYAAGGDYTATLTVTDDAGCSTSRTFTGQTVSCNGSSAATTTHTVSVDGTPPDTLIDSAPHGTGPDPSPSFDFHATEPGSTFECSIDTGTPSWGACSGAGSHTPASPLADGDYSFRVRATDPVGNTDPTPASEDFTVDTTAPDTLIDSAPHGTGPDPSPSFDFHATEPGSTFECSIDTGTPSWGACSGAGSHTPASPLADGDYSFRVRATDPVGNTDPTPASEDFTVATPAPSSGSEAETSCPLVAVAVSNYTPSPAAFAATAAGQLGPTRPGVRAKVTIDQPSQLLIAARLRWTQDGRPHSVDLGARAIASQGMRNLRLALPRSLGDELPRGTPVNLALRIVANPDSAPGCSSPSVQRLTLATEVVRVLASSARLKFKPPVLAVG